MALAVADAASHNIAASGFLPKIRNICDTQLRPLALAIDREGLYPESIMRNLGAAGAFASHTSGAGSGQADLRQAIDAMAIAGETCLSTSFCMWCQDALGWYLATSQNRSLYDALGRRVTTGEQLGGTGLSNPMKCFFGIEKLRLKGKRVDGGYIVDGRLPWVSNLGKDHWFGAIFELADKPEVRIMAAIDCAGPGVSIQQSDHFVALEGTRTFSVKFTQAFVPDEQIIAEPVNDYIPKIRAGFILLQAGMAFGLIKGCIDLMKQVERSHGHVNKYLEKQPADFEVQLEAMQETVYRLAQTPFETDKAYFRQVVEARLAAGEASVAAAHYAMLHQGACGYLDNADAQRRLREAYFVAIVTPATKQLRKMLAEYL